MAYIVQHLYNKHKTLYSNISTAREGAERGRGRKREGRKEEKKRKNELPLWYL
jgi:hypothetical protein